MLASSSSSSPPHDPEPLAKNITDVLLKEAKEKALNREAIASLRRRSFKTGGRNTAAVSAVNAKSRHKAAAAAATATKGETNAHFVRRSDHRIRRLRSLPDTTPSQGARPRDHHPLRRRDSAVPLRDFTESGVSDSSGAAVGRIGGGVGGNRAVGNAVGNTVGNDVSNAVGSGSGNKTKKVETGWWPPSDGDASAGRGGVRGMPPDVARTDALPAKLSCGYCRKRVRVQVLDLHEERCPSRNPELFATPCVGCGFQGPRCACWALRNGLLKETRAQPEKPLFALFKNSREARAREGRVSSGDGCHGRSAAAAGFAQKGSAGFLADWKAGEEMRRPQSLTVEASSDLDETSTETAEQRWRRERDDWLFGRSPATIDESSGAHHSAASESSRPPTPPLPPRAPACGFGGGEGREEGQVPVEESDEAFMVRDRIQMRSHFERVRDAARVRQYTERWFKFSSDPPDEIRHQDVPWLPKLSTCARGLRGGKVLQQQHERFETLGVSEGDTSDVKKAALRAASLRWHPDKFMSKHGPKIASADRARIANDVQATMQRITKLRERLHQTDAARKGRTTTTTLDCTENDK